jgi:uncharacterized protein with HEPN domain
MGNDIKTWLFDILTFINEIVSFIESIGNDLEVFEKDLKTRRAVERNLSVIGEAATRISRKDPSVQLTDMRLIINTRNKLVHGYEQISEQVIWQIVHEDLPILKEEVTQLLET